MSLKRTTCIQDMLMRASRSDLVQIYCYKHIKFMCKCSHFWSDMEYPGMILPWWKLRVILKVWCHDNPLIVLTYPVPCLLNSMNESTGEIRSSDFWFTDLFVNCVISCFCFEMIRWYLPEFLESWETRKDWDQVVLTFQLWQRSEDFCWLLTCSFRSSVCLVLWPSSCCCSSWDDQLLWNLA